MQKKLIIGIFIFAAFLFACSFFSAVSEPTDETESPRSGPAPLSSPPVPPSGLGSGGDKWSLWISGTQLRGANTWQRIIVPKYDGDEFLGDGYIGPPYTQDDFNALAAWGANYVNLSHPGVFTERRPYVLDNGVADSRACGRASVLGKDGLCGHRDEAVHNGTGGSQDSVCSRAYRDRLPRLHRQGFLARCPRSIRSECAGRLRGRTADRRR